MNAPRPEVRSRGARSFLLLLALGLLTLAGGLLTACGQPEGVVTVRMEGLKFTPQVVTIDPGTTVRWVNEDETAHTSTADGWSPDQDDPQKWNSFPMSPGDVFERTFESSGSFDYFCMVHPYMTGTVTVR